ncbi:MAG: hypothetical protein AB7P07_00230 [Hyphomonadaceae bacterium]
MNMAPQFWRFLPALCVAAAIPIAMFGDVSGDRVGRLSGFDWESLRIIIIGALAAAGFAFYQAPRIDGLCAGLVSAAGLSAAWCAFQLPGLYGSDALVVSVLMLGFWGFAALLIVGTAYHRFRWLRWIALPVLSLACLGALAWFGYTLIYVYWPALMAEINRET